MDRKEIAIIYIKKDQWIAGAYYLQNLISALNLLEDFQKPFINVFCDSTDDYDELVKITRYPYSKLAGSIQFSFFQKIINKPFRLFFGDKVIMDRLDMRKTNNIFMFPFYEGRPHRSMEKILPWKPDFQEKYYPQFFSQKALEFRDKWMRYHLENSIPIVFSSNDAFNDCKKFYPEYECKPYILQFAVFHPDYSALSINDIKRKYCIEGEYFFVANQFWIHKNHLFLFKAYKKYRDAGGKKLLVCSGKLQDKRFPEYTSDIKLFIHQNGLEAFIKILGFIDRSEQLCLMSNSYAIIQPSLFEGWSTVVEDAKAMNKFIYLSNLPVHIEQSPVNACYFDPHNQDDLTEKLLKIVPTTINFDYCYNQKMFALKFLEIINTFGKNIL